MIEEPWLIRYCLRIIPIQMITETEIDKIKQNVIKLKIRFIKMILTELQLRNETRTYRPLK